MQHVIEEPGDFVHYINLDRVPARKRFMETQFARAGLNSAHRVRAIDAGQDAALDQNGYVPGTGTRWGLKRSEIACFESHRLVWRQALERDAPAVAVFEDDVEMSAGAGAVITELLRNPSEFDFVKLDYSPRSLRFGAETTIGSIVVRPMLEMAPSAAAYVVSQEACRKLLGWSESYSDHLDDFVSLPRPGWRMYQCFPAVGVQMIWSASQTEVEAPVAASERTQDIKTNSGLDKGPAWFRVRRELRAATRKLYWRLGAQTRLLDQGGYVGYIPCADDLKV
ncbi:glycosyltransferase family 25 protein [Ruegeria sp. HKCCA6707]|uniref:glycosyltransferase family 25 protein n=1 Tax=unclassified Ruegeria TaxID=2625375 RepID=UPI001489D4BF